MAGRWQKASLKNNPPANWKDQFAQFGYSAKWTCITCGTQGYMGDRYPTGWQVSCLMGHPEKCEGCGARFIKGGLAKHLNCRSNHGACCACHTDTQYRRLQRHLIDGGTENDA